MLELFSNIWVQQIGTVKPTSQGHCGYPAIIKFHRSSLHTICVSHIFAFMNVPCREKKKKTKSSDKWRKIQLCIYHFLGGIMAF